MHRIVTIQHPAVVCHHPFIPKALIACLHCLNVLMKSFTLLVADRAKVCRKKVQVRMQKWIFSDIRQPISLYASSKFSTPVLNEGDFLLPKKFAQSHLNAFQAWSSIEVSSFSKSGSFKTSRICGPTKMPSFSFASLILGNLLHRNAKPLDLLFSSCLKKFLN